jgi:molybdenum cofactor cytidylyltransferase
MRVSAILLAAGRSTRMGSAKQLLKIGGKTLLEIVLDTLRATQVDEIIVVLGGSAEAIQEQVPLHNFRVVINELYQQGMATSLQAGVSAVDPASDAALIVLADQPFLRPDTIARLIDEYCALKPVAVVPMYDGVRGNPILLDRSLFPEIMELIGDAGCRSILSKHSENILKIPVEDIGILLDVDTQADLERFQGTLGPQLLNVADVADRRQ